MPLARYIAMTAAEYDYAQTLPTHIAWMACHFSCYGLGLSNLPQNLPENSMVILNDRTPVYHHDPQMISDQLMQVVQSLKVSHILLDFQRADQENAVKIAQALIEELPCPVGISDIYAKELDCPVFLPPPPLHVPLKEHLEPWQDRQIWLEASTDAETITVTEKGSAFVDGIAHPLQEPIFEEEQLYCRYHIEIQETAAIFTLERDREHLEYLLSEAEKLGVELAVGLYQQLGK